MGPDSPKVFAIEGNAEKIGLKLEATKGEWEKAEAWTKELYGQDQEDEEAEREKLEYIQRCEAELERQVQQIWEAENPVSVPEDDKSMSPRRIVVTNIAADAGTEELADVFSDFAL